MPTDESDIPQGTIVLSSGNQCLGTLGESIGGIKDVQCTAIEPTESRMPELKGTATIGKFKPVGKRPRQILKALRFSRRPYYPWDKLLRDAIQSNELERISFKLNVQPL